MAKFELDDERDFTPSGLRDFLNDKFGCKTNGSEFNNQDIQQYRLRKKLPEEYGGQHIIEINKPQFNLKILRLK